MMTDIGVSDDNMKHEVRSTTIKNCKK